MKIKKSELIKLNESLKKWIKLTEGKKIGKKNGQKIVCITGISPSHFHVIDVPGMQKWFELKGVLSPEEEYFENEEDRAKPLLVKYVEEKKPKHLKIVTIPADIEDWSIEDDKEEEDEEVVVDNETGQTWR